MRQFMVGLPLLRRVYPVTVMSVATKRVVNDFFLPYFITIPGLHTFVLNVDHNMTDD